MTIFKFLDPKIWDSGDEKLNVGKTIRYCYTFTGLFSLSSKMKTSKIIQAKDADLAKIQFFSIFCATFWKYIRIIVISLPPTTNKFILF